MCVLYCFVDEMFIIVELMYICYCGIIFIFNCDAIDCQNEDEAAKYQCSLLNSNGF